MEAPDSVPGTPRGGEPRRPLPLRQARLPAAPSAGGPALIVLVPQGPGELRQADWLPCSPCRPSQVGSARLHPAPLSQVCACTPSLFLQMPVALCLQNLSATEAPVLPWLRFSSGPYGPPSSPSHLSSCLGPGWGSSEHCWEKPLARTLVEQKLLTSSFLPSRGGTVTFSKAAQGPDGSWRWILP